MTNARLHLLAVAGLALAALVLLLPGGSGAIGHPTGDMPDHLWGTWWFGRELLAGRLPLFTDVTHFPDRVALWHIDPVGALLALPLRWLGWPTAWNAMLAVQVTGTGLAAYAMTWDLLRSRAGAAFAGLALMGSPFLLGVLHSGLSEFAGLGLVVLYAWTLIRTFGPDPRGREPLRRGALAAGLLLGACTVQSFYFGAFGGLLAAGFAAGAGWKDRVRSLAVLGATWALTCLPWLLPLMDTIRGGGAVSDATAPAWSDSFLPATDLLTFLRPGAYYFPDTPALGNPGILQVNYLGWGMLLLAAWGFVRRPTLRPLLPPMAVYGVLMLGPRLAVAGHVFTLPGTHLALRLPLGLLYFAGSPLTLVHHPYRMVALMLPLLALAAAAGVAGLRPRLQVGLGALALAEPLFLSPGPWPITATPIDPPALALEAGEGPRLDWPPDASTWNRRYLLWQVAHHQPIPYGVNVFLGDELRADPLVARLLSGLDDPVARARNRDVPFRGPVQLEARGRRSELASLGLRTFLLHRDALSAGELDRTHRVLEQAWGPPRQVDDETEIWDVRDTTLR